ncbi:MAG: hypothetical protein B6I25_06315 [Planctomycetales bacterium 4572_13]|nr:MAG: hypothetical protein B6I25_06315 [Planctomycetales bacterium 4572_13]
MKDDLTYLHHICDAVETIFEYLEGVDLPQFQSEKMRVDAVVRELMMIGEAASHISNSFKEKHPIVQWKKIRGMRNFLVHEYFGVNVKVVWDTCRNSLPKLHKTIKAEFLF